MADKKTTPKTCFEDLIPSWKASLRKSPRKTYSSEKPAPKAMIKAVPIMWGALVIPKALAET